jgi:uncharacterized protein (PEP-CTERM system associated)
VKLRTPGLGPTRQVLGAAATQPDPPTLRNGSTLARGGRFTATAAVCLLGAGVCASALAQGSGFSSSLTASTTYSDVRGRTGDAPDRQFISQISPGLSWSSRSGRVQGAARYNLVGSFYSKQSDADTWRQALSANLSAEAVPDWMFVDTQASISQQAISPFGQQSLDDSQIDNNNRTEVRSITVSPYIRGNLFGLANYQVRLSATQTDGGRAQASDSKSRTASASLASPNSGAVFGWSLAATRQESSFDSGADSATESVTAGVNANIDSLDLQLGLTAGRESSNVIRGERRSTDTWGWNLRWTPTPRTSVAVNSQRRYFGDSHSVSLLHRMQRSTWTYTDIRSDSLGANGLALGRPITLFALYFDLFAAQEPDPVRREVLVLDYLRSIGQDPGALVAVGFITSSVTLQRRQDLAFGMQWPRTTLNLRAFRNQTSRLQEGQGALPGQAVRQKGYTASLSRQLTPTTSVSLTGSRQITPSDGLQPGTGLKSASLSFSNRISRQINGALTLRHTVFSSETNPYRESAATASLNVRF